MHALQKQIKILFGNDVEIETSRGLAGGCINDTQALHLNNGETVFLKKNTLIHPEMFDAEAMGLNHLRVEGGPRVPKPLSSFKDRTHQYLLLEFLKPSSKAGDYWEQFGRQLAHLHKTKRHSHCGFAIDNFIGATPQINEYRDSWCDFYREMRLEPQIRLASTYLGKTIRSKLRQLLDQLHMYITPLEGSASVLHGDLWTGNAMVGPMGEPVIIDPATYYGHREAEIAMTQLFGRFGGRFYDAYDEYWPLQSGWQERMDLYNLYHMLNHVNLFGSGYLGSVSAIVSRYT